MFNYVSARDGGTEIRTEVKFAGLIHIDRCMGIAICLIHILANLVVVRNMAKCRFSTFFQF
jgi:hypothetical protein